MIKNRYIFIAIALSMCLMLGVAYAEADTSICYNCGGKGYTSITIMRTQVIGYNSVTGMPTTIQIPDEQHIPCATCGGSGRVYDYSSSSSSSSLSSSSSSSSDGSSSSNTAIGKNAKNGTVLDATDGVGDYEDAQNLLDGKKKTKFNVLGKRLYIIWKAPKKMRVKSYVVTTANDTKTYKGRNPKTWALYGSNKKLSRKAKGWKKIHSVKNDKKLKAANFKSVTYKLKKRAKAYRYYKLEIKENKGADCTQLAELTLKNK